MLSIIISFLSDSILDTFPVILRPLLGNGFVVGVLAVLIMEHLIFQRKNGPEPDQPQGQSPWLVWLFNP